MPALLLMGFNFESLFELVSAHVRNLIFLKPTTLLCQLLMNICVCRLILQISTNAPVLF